MTDDTYLVEWPADTEQTRAILADPCADLAAIVLDSRGFQSIRPALAFAKQASRRSPARWARLSEGWRDAAGYWNTEQSRVVEDGRLVSGWTRDSDT